MSTQSPFIDPSLAIIFAYAPAGLGHLRVTDALRHGLPPEAAPILLPAREESIRIMHRVTSVHPFYRRFMEWAQYGRPQELVTKIYRKILLSDAPEMEQQLFEIYKQRVELPKTLLVVASHFGIAHQVGAIKKKLENRADVRIILIVQVTDDSPQTIWYVPGADITFVPSEYTKETLLEYGRSHYLPPVHFEVAPYPLSPHLGERLTKEKLKQREEQRDPNKDTVIQIIIPVSGAAVGVTFGAELIKRLHKFSHRFHFHVVAKRSVFTDVLLQQVEHKSYVQTYTSHSDRQIVELYETAYSQNVISLEVTKPSEQAFKAMFCPEQLGGVILLFSTPVGRQEYDNLNFLRRHTFIPGDEEQTLLFHLYEQNENLTREQQKHFFSLAETWRGIRIPDDPVKAAHFIWWCHKNGLFASMHKCNACARGDDLCKHEVGDDGVKKLWERVEKLL